MNWMTRRLFGTDGIRGKVSGSLVSEEEAIHNLHENRQVSPNLMRLLGEVLGRVHDTMSGQGNLVVIGWDERPNNELLAEYLTVGLQISGCQVMQIGICATPTLHYSTLYHGARIGCMITASHNPVSDSGLKVFDSQGYKTAPQFEDELSVLAESLSQEEREIDMIEHDKVSIPIHGLIDEESTIGLHKNWLTERFKVFKYLFGQVNQNSKISKPLLIDSSKGFASKWFAGWLTDELGIESQEISQSASEMNHNCGAGEMSPTQTWTFDQAKTDPHLLLRKLLPAAPGTIVAAALDGDGDRCLIIEATDTGFKVVDGDAMADIMINAGTIKSGEWTLAASIESDLSLLSGLERFPQEVSTKETAVGDRWLSVALSPVDDMERLLKGKNSPRILGVEDSGHIVLPSPHPVFKETWTLVGDGTATLTSFLLALLNHNPQSLMNRGWKKRESASNVERNLWDGDNALSDEVEQIAKAELSRLGIISNWKRSKLVGEDNLMLIHSNFNEGELSLGIRNSGTQAKISVSLRLSSNIQYQGMEELVRSLVEFLKLKMTK